MGAWVAADITTGAFVALFRAFVVEPPTGVDELHFETGIWLHPSFWQGGLSVEVTAMSYDFLFDETPVDVLYAATHRENKPGLGLFRGLNLEFVGNSVAEHENGSQVPAYLYQARRRLWRRSCVARDSYEEIAATKEASINRFSHAQSFIRDKKAVV
jgi:RimJ/RimL family protein N-acetyltransferase